MLTDSSNAKPTIIRDKAICRAVAQDYGGYVQCVPDGTTVLPHSRRLASTT